MANEKYLAAINKQEISKLARQLMAAK